MSNMRIDDLSTFSYFTILAVILLSSLGYLAGIVGFVVVSILLSVALFFAVVWGKNLGRSFANAPADKEKVEGEAMVIALASLCYAAYLSLGLHELVLYLKQSNSLGLLFYLWVISISAPIVLWVILANYQSYKDR